LHDPFQIVFDRLLCVRSFESIVLILRRQE
jgi:hypothetical protein